MINPKQVATLGVGFGALAVAAFGLVVSTTEPIQSPIQGGGYPAPTKEYRVPSQRERATREQPKVAKHGTFFTVYVSVLLNGKTETRIYNIEKDRKVDVDVSNIIKDHNVSAKVLIYNYNATVTFT